MIASEEHQWLLTISEAANVLSVGRGTFLKWALIADFKVIKLPGDRHHYYSYSQIVNWADCLPRVWTLA